MRKIFSLLIMLLITTSLPAQGIGGKAGIGGNAGIGGGAPAAPPTFGQAPTPCTGGSGGGPTAITCVISGSVTAGQFIVYESDMGASSGTMTVSDNCGGTYITDVGPTIVSFNNVQAGHSTGSSGSCTVSVLCSLTFTQCTITIATMSGASAFDVGAALNTQSSPGTGANAVTSNAVTTNFRDLCFGYTIEGAGAGSGTITAGTTIAWTLGASSSAAFNAGIEYFTQAGAGSITATFTDTTAGSTRYTTGVSCFH
jgi:hypothetical protein